MGCVIVHNQPRWDHFEVLLSLVYRLPRCLSAAQGEGAGVAATSQVKGYDA